MHELEDEAIAEHATYQYSAFKQQPAKLKKDIKLMRLKFAQCRRA